MPSELARVIENGRRIVFFGGAGVSTESGIPDFRSGDGLYRRAAGTRSSPEQVLSHSFFVGHTPSSTPTTAATCSTRTPGRTPRTSRWPASRTAAG